MDFPSPHSERAKIRLEFLLRLYEQILSRQRNMRSNFCIRHILKENGPQLDSTSAGRSFGGGGGRIG
jgi:hypothetical protein